ncbi:hypothetical protein GIB67_019495 [Kingdonia uniflora]|uniref:GAGA-binding transcriptional activator n=1 Tax=Kingdonia uniflora TaxID=39325 RepID=A0A7J7N042_9MAGN|nr:hypothetical protein GIB67_019495 [Kingdonia uniflora]
MDGSGRQREGGSSQRENGRYKQDMYKGYHTSEAGSSERENVRFKQEQQIGYQNQWMIPPHILRDPHALTMKFVSIITERDNAREQRDLALAERKAAFEERDMAILQRDSAFAERNNAVQELDNTIQEYQYRRNTRTMDGTNPSAD